ncbi:flagellar hook-length control protein FliK [Paracoccus spongiarum]|uniref:Flagellar hook-length control protein FliK n=1 Tax=Paracoccus spongiarum TaxID=3064387 RepID=A0ABT9JG70_9RHOB|nr:flagellar hook-length control protein FliK [Paracoccus sp. 2205BS29-5]MDP5308774.1 flagellar hook-length control protein FliK [Paracoccus sp. 2205BS29-5]
MNSSVLNSLHLEHSADPAAPRKAESVPADPAAAAEFEGSVDAAGAAMTPEGVAAVEVEEVQAAPDIAASEDGTDDAAPEDTRTARPVDPLEQLLEAWSGISGALSEAEPAPAGTDEAGARGIDRLAVALRLARGADAMHGSAEAADAGPPAILEDGALPPAKPAVAPSETGLLPKVSIAEASGAQAEAAGGVEKAAKVALDELAIPAAPIRAGHPAQPIAAGTEARPIALHAQPVLRQIADAVVAMKGDRLEIALSPEELGRVRLVVTGAERAAQVTVWVERPEVMDLLRRNVGLLTQHFGEAGLEGAAFDFREERGRDAAPDDRDLPDDLPEGLPDMRALTTIHAVAMPGRWIPGDRRLDMRL